MAINTQYIPISVSATTANQVLENDHNGGDNLPGTMMPTVAGSYYNQVSYSPHLHNLFPPDTV